MSRTFVVLILLLAAGAFAGAEPPAGKTEITVHSGWSFLDAANTYNACPVCLVPYNPTVNETIRGSMLFGFKGGYYINRTMEVEGGFALAPGHKLEQVGIPVPVCSQGIPCPYDLIYPLYLTDLRAVAYQYEGNFVYNIGAGAVTPFATFGVGGVATALSGTTYNDFAFNFGGGAKFYFGNVGLRLEVNDHVIPNYFLNDRTEHDVQVQYGFVFRL